MRPQWGQVKEQIRRALIGAGIEGTAMTGGMAIAEAAYMTFRDTSFEDVAAATITMIGALAEKPKKAAS